MLSCQDYYQKAAGDILGRIIPKTLKINSLSVNFRLFVDGPAVIKRFIMATGMNIVSRPKLEAATFGKRRGSFFWFFQLLQMFKYPADHISIIDKADDLHLGLTLKFLLFLPWLIFDRYTTIPLSLWKLSFATEKGLRIRLS